MKDAREKETIITIMVGCIILSMAFSLSVIWFIALAVGIAGIVSDKLTHWIHKVWFLLADILGYVMSRIILGILFFVILLPVAMMAKLIRKDFMMLKNRSNSFFVERNIEYQSKDLENPW
jgi:hypothetical protein